MTEIETRICTDVIPHISRALTYMNEHMITRISGKAVHCLVCGKNGGEHEPECLFAMLAVVSHITFEKLDKSEKEKKDGKNDIS